MWRRYSFDKNVRKYAHPEKYAAVKKAPIAQPEAKEASKKSEKKAKVVKTVKKKKKKAKQPPKEE
jgi:hypothetical protein